MIQNRLRPDTRVRLKTRRCDNWRDRWRSEGTIVEVRATTAVALVDDHPSLEGCWYDWHEGEVEAPHYDWAIMRDQEPNPDHAAALGPLLALTSS